MHEGLISEEGTWSQEVVADIAIHCTAGKILVTLKTDSEFLFLLLSAFLPPSLGTAESFGRGDDDVWAGKSNGSGRYGGTYRALSAECHAFVELPKGPGQAVAFQSQSRKHPMGLQWLVLVWIIRRD